MNKKIWFSVYVMIIGMVGLNAEIPISKMAGQMLMVGFHGTSAPKDSQICRDIREYNLGGVILFDFNPVDKNKPKNIADKAQLAKLTKELQACSSDGKLLIAVDQEGGRVQRLKSKYGFYGQYPKAKDVINMSDTQVKSTYEKMAKELKSVGINYDLAPVVDLSLNPKNHVINGLGRSFGKDPKKVAHFSSLFIDAMHSPLWMKGVYFSLGPIFFLITEPVLKIRKKKSKKHSLRPKT